MDEPTGTTLRRTARLALMVGTVCLGAVAAGTLAMILAAAGDGVPPDDYEAGGRAAFFFGFVASTGVACFTGLVGFWLAWTSRRPERPLFSLAVAFSTFAVVVAVVPCLWNRQ